MSLEFLNIALTMESSGEGSTPDLLEPECSMNIQGMRMDNHVIGSDVAGIHLQISSNLQLKSLVSEFGKNKGLEETERCTFAQISCSRKSDPVQYSKSFSVESKLNKSIYTSPDCIFQTSSSAIHNIESKSWSSQSRLCEEDYLNISRLAELIKRYEKKTHQSSHGYGGTCNSSSALFESLAQERIAEAEDRSSIPETKTPQSTQSYSKKASVRVSRTLVRTSTTEGMKSANEQSKRKAKKDKKGKRQDQSSHVRIKNSKVVPSQENKATVDIKNKPRNVFFPNEGKEEIKSKINALGRRKAYEAKRKLDEIEALAAKQGGKISKRQNTNTTLQVSCVSNEPSFSMKNLKEITTVNVEANTKKRKSNKQLFVDTETDIIGKMLEPTPFVKRKAHTNNKQPEETVIEADDLKNNEDDLELITQHKSVDEDRKSSENLHLPWDLQDRPMSQKDIHDTHQEVITGRDVNQSENVDRRPGKELYTQNIRYKPPYCFKYVHPDIAKAYENLNRIPEYTKLKEDNGRNVSREKLSSYDIAINQYLSSKSRNVKTKVIVGYVPDYGAVRGIEGNVDRACRKDKSDNYFLVSYPDVMEKQPRPGSPQREIIGHGSGYGPVRGAPIIKRKPDWPSEKVVFPEINLGRPCNPNGDKRSYGMKKQVDVLESSPEVKHFNTNINEEASSRFRR